MGALLNHYEYNGVPWEDAKVESFGLKKFSISIC